jgi:hypothetical protein
VQFPNFFSLHCPNLEQPIDSIALLTKNTAV